MHWSRSVERTETDACGLGTPFPSKGETSGRAAGLGQAGGPHGRSRRPVQPCAQQAGRLPRVQSLQLTENFQKSFCNCKSNICLL